ncbi:MAG: hypothetical protein P8I91_02325 [Phycisphaerales bacterium]|nr:hypothetical protein [Phycisphaerales bacterium]
MTDTLSTDSKKCSSGGGCPAGRAVYLVAHIAILTCISMALWKAAWALEAIAALPSK